MGLAEGTAVVSGEQSGHPRLLTAAETAAPVDAVDVIAEDLRRRFGATQVSFLIVDLTGKAVARLSTAPAEDGLKAERIPVFGSAYEEVIRTQQLYQEVTDQGQRVIVPVTNRGDAIGLLELLLPADPGKDVLDEVEEAAHVLAYIVIANERFTDFYTWGKHSKPTTLAAEIQYQLLPSSLSCEAAQFTLCGSLEPSEDLSGDTFDYTLQRDALHVSVTDPMGHDLDAALAATVLVSALRGARRAGSRPGRTGPTGRPGTRRPRPRARHRAAAAHQSPYRAGPARQRGTPLATAHARGRCRGDHL